MWACLVHLGLSADPCLIGHSSSALCLEVQPEPGASTLSIGLWPGLGAGLREVLHSSRQSVLTGNTVGSSMETAPLSVCLI